MIDERIYTPWKVYVHIVPKYISKLNRDKYYVGVTSKPNPEDRWLNGEGYSTQPFYRAIKKFGWDNIEHFVVADNLTVDEDHNLEKVLIEKLNSYIKKDGYNVQLSGCTLYLSSKGEIYQFNYNGDVVGKYSDVEDYECKTGHSGGNLDKRCSEDDIFSKSVSYGYIWRYKKDIDNIGISEFQKWIKSKIFTKIEPIVQMSKDLEFIREYNNINEVKKLNPDYDSHKIISLCGRIRSKRKREKYYDNYVWVYKKDIGDSIKDFVEKYKDEYKDKKYSENRFEKVEVYTLDLKLVKEFNDFIEVSDYIGNKDPMYIQKSCNEILNNTSRNGITLGYLMCYSNNIGEAKFRLPAHKKGIPIYCVLLKNKRLIRVFKSMNDLEEYLNMEGIQYSGSLMRGNFLIYENDLDVISTVNGNIEFDLKGEVSYG